MIKNIIRGIGIAVVFLAGVMAARWFFEDKENVAEEQSTVLLERIRAVTKLITVEGYFSEIYDYKDYWGYDLSPFRKKALIRVKAKVSVGYDLSTLKIDALTDEQRIVIGPIPEPEILSIDHDLDYYDIQEGTFNSFTSSDYTRLNTNAKEYVRKKALESDLYDAAEKQGQEIMELIRFMVESSGWTLEIHRDTSRVFRK